MLGVHSVLGNAGVAMPWRMAHSLGVARAWGWPTLRCFLFGVLENEEFFFPGMILKHH